MSDNKKLLERVARETPRKEPQAEAKDTADDADNAAPKDDDKKKKKKKMEGRDTGDGKFNDIW
jgi:hypothetical protein